MKELSKSIARRMREPAFSLHYFKGEGIDIGGKPDPLTLYRSFFPLMGNVRIWDLEDGDAQFMVSASDNSVDFIHSSHCLEHLNDPEEGLRNWLRVVKPGGHIIVTIPEEDLYEQGVFPSTFNRDHKATFTLWKSSSWSRRSFNILEILTRLGPAAQPVKIEMLAASYRFDLPRFDQTSTPVGECAIEFIIRKRTAAEIAAGGRLPTLNTQPDSSLRLHYNQYSDDYKTMKSGNASRQPFTNDSEL
jgi:SAM-dependent methyltransferase